MRSCWTLIGATLIAVLASFPARADDPPPATSKARWVVSFLKGLDVEHRWIAGTHVDWQTGLPDNAPERLPGRHTHCSAFVASAAQQLGIYILRPPEHGQVLLANAQNEWLAEAGAAQGWKPVSGPQEAQALANRGEFVVASYLSHRSTTPGHIAIVLPGEKSAAQIEAEGPDVMQAGTVNSASTPLASGFAGHPHAWGDREVAFYSHTVKAPE
jgi:hypothetical protein